MSGPEHNPADDMPADKEAYEAWEREQIASVAIGAAQWVTASPHEWVWTPDQQVAMARYIMCASHELDLWRWLTEMRCTVQEDSNINAPKWAVLDVDGDVIGRGATPVEAIEAAKQPEDL